VKSKKGHAQAHGGHGNIERWLLTYADMITLLVAFFIMLYSMSVMNAAKFRQLALSVRSGFGGQLPATGAHLLKGEGLMIAGPAVGRSKKSETEATVEKLVRLIKQSGMSKSVRVHVDERGLVVSLITDGVLFDRGSAELRRDMIPVLNGLINILWQNPHPIRVEGHTCNLPISGRYASNWELSTARATNVVRYFIEKRGLDPKRLSAAGYADSRPIAPNDTEAHRSLNRRVDIVLLLSERLHK